MQATNNKNEVLNSRNMVVAKKDGVFKQERRDSKITVNSRLSKEKQQQVMQNSLKISL